MKKLSILIIPLFFFPSSIYTQWQPDVRLEFSLKINYPNPFTPVTKIRFDIPNPDLVIIKIFDILGCEIAVLVNEQMQLGTYQAEFDGSNFSSGAYFYQLTAGTFTQTKRMVLIK